MHECEEEQTFITMVLYKERQGLLRLQGVVLTYLWDQGKDRTVPSITCNTVTAFTPRLHQQYKIRMILWGLDKSQIEDI